MSACTSNSDIDGLGIRFATYLQLLIGFFTLAISPAHADDSWWTIIVTSFGVQIAAIADYRDLSLYDGLIVTWLGFPAFMMSFYYGALMLVYEENKVKKIKFFMATVLHCLLYIGFCLWIWSTVGTFGANRDCNAQIKFALFLMVNPTGNVKYLVFTVIALWIVQMAYFIIRVVSIKTPYAFERKHWFSVNARFTLLSILNLGSLILAIFMIEKMVMENKELVNNNSNGHTPWTFGQIIALILVAGPVTTLINVLHKEYKRGLSGNLDRRPAAALMARISGCRELDGGVIQTEDGTKNLSGSSSTLGPV